MSNVIKLECIMRGYGMTIVKYAIIGLAKRKIKHLKFSR